MTVELSELDRDWMEMKRVQLSLRGGRIQMKNDLEDGEGSTLSGEVVHVRDLVDLSPGYWGI